MLKRLFVPTLLCIQLYASCFIAPRGPCFWTWGGLAAIHSIASFPLKGIEADSAGLQLRSPDFELFSTEGIIERSCIAATKLKEALSSIYKMASIYSSWADLFEDTKIKKIFSEHTSKVATDFRPGPKDQNQYTGAPVNKCYRSPSSPLQASSFIAFIFPSSKASRLPRFRDPRTYRGSGFKTQFSKLSLDSEGKDRLTPFNILFFKV